MPVFEGIVETFASWTSEQCTNSLNGFVSGSTKWGLLKWDQSLPNVDAEVFVDVLKASDESILAADLVWNKNGINLANYPNVGSEDIKLRFKFNWIDKSPEVSNIDLTFEQME